MFESHNDQEVRVTTILPTVQKGKLTREAKRPNHTAFLTLAGSWAAEPRAFCSIDKRRQVRVWSVLWPCCPCGFQGGTECEL